MKALKTRDLSDNSSGRCTIAMMGSWLLPLKFASETSKPILDGHANPFE